MPQIFWSSGVCTSLNKVLSNGPVAQSIIASHNQPAISYSCYKEPQSIKSFNSKACFIARTIVCTGFCTHKQPQNNLEEDLTCILYMEIAGIILLKKLTWHIIFSRIEKSIGPDNKHKIVLSTAYILSTNQSHYPLDRFLSVEYRSIIQRFKNQGLFGCLGQIFLLSKTFFSP